MTDWKMTDWKMTGIKSQSQMSQNLVLIVHCNCNMSHFRTKLCQFLIGGLQFAAGRVALIDSDESQTVTSTRPLPEQQVAQLSQRDRTAG